MCDTFNGDYLEGLSLTDSIPEFILPWHPTLNLVPKMAVDGVFGKVDG